MKTAAERRQRDQISFAQAAVGEASARAKGIVAAEVFA